MQMELSAGFRVQLGVGRCSEVAAATLPAFYLGTPADNALYNVQSVHFGARIHG
jgi:hypothetical protein